MTDPNGKPDASQEDEGTSEFDATFDEIAEAQAAADAADGDKAEPEGSADEPPASSGRDDAGDGNQADGSGAPDPSAKQASDKEPVDPQAAFAALQRENEALKHRLASDDGRVAALNRELNLLRKQQNGGNGENPEALKSLKDLIETDDLKQWREEFPEVAEPVLRLLQTQQSMLDNLMGKVGKIDEAAAEGELDQQFAIYERAHPDWRDYTSPTSKYGTAFSGWLANQPRYVIEAVERNANAIVDANEAADVLARFKREAGLSDPPAADPKPDARRQRQLAAATDVRTKTPPTSSDVPDDFDTAFEAAARKLEKQARR